MKLAKAVGTLRRKIGHKETHEEGTSPSDRAADKPKAQGGDADNPDADEKTVAGLPPFPDKFAVTLVETERQANKALRHIVEGAVGFDTEFTDRRPTAEEAMIEARFPKGSALRRSAVLGWQIVELGAPGGFKVAWDNVGLRCVQIAKDKEAWVLDMRKIRAVPQELDRILTSPKIQKVGVGVASDVMVIWDDLRREMQHIVDAGLMAKLAMAERYPKGGFSNLSLKTSVEDVLGFELNKELTTSNWAADELSEEQQKYAALDAIAALQLYEVLKDELKRKAESIGQPIPEAWYTFNSRSGEPTRLKLSADGGEIAWKTSDCKWYAGGRFQGYP